MTWPAGPVVVRAPASSANLGPGFDCVGLALGLHDEVEARVSGHGVSVTVDGEGAATAALGGRHLVARAMLAGFAHMNAGPPGIALRCRNAIPHGRGLGSSAAAIVSGLLAARALVSDGGVRLPDADLLRLAVDLEGHPDNVAACLAGGLTIAWSPDQGGLAAPPPVRLLRLDPAEGLTTIACIPPFGVPTERARRALPSSVPHADAARNAARSALLVAALTRDPRVLFDATEDFVHQRYRAPVMPQTAELLHRLRAAGIAAVISGAGPAVLALVTGAGPPGPAQVDSIAAETGIAWHVTPLGIDRRGATVA